MGLVELLRRAMWALLRVENEVLLTGGGDVAPDYAPTLGNVWDYVSGKAWEISLATLSTRVLKPRCLS